MTRRRPALLLAAALPILLPLALIACRSTPALRTTLPVLSDGDSDPALGYEAPPVLRARDLLPDEIRRGPHHEVDETVLTDGFLYLYDLRSDFGDFEVVGDALLHQRVNEIRALAELAEIHGTSEFASAVAKGLKSPFVATWNLLTSPVDSLLGIPVGAWETMTKTVELGRIERSEYEDGALRELIGFEDLKRQLAYRLGVDPYSSNSILQQELNRTAWASYVGGFPFKLIPFQGDDEEDAAAELMLEPDSIMIDHLLRDPPEDLRRFNRIELAVMGVEPELADAFLSHPWFSPRHQTVLVSSLVALDPARDRHEFIEAALTARAESDALVYQWAAEMLRAYHEKTRPLTRLSASGGLIRAYDADGARIAPLAVDHLIWTRPTARLVHDGADPDTADPARREVWLSGTASEKARQEMESLGFVVVERALDRIATSGEASDEDAPATGEDAPATGEDAPATGEDAPATGEDAPATGGGAP